ncbi:MAG TPA: hypothetical protein VK450_01895, partial [Methanomicrobiales archaeon]|nr:hypothetical protein [Methanomicrobiales archaeon]
GIFREGEGMREGLRNIRALGERAARASPGNKGIAMNQALVRYLELGGMLRVAGWWPSGPSPGRRAGGPIRGGISRIAMTRGSLPTPMP